MKKETSWKLSFSKSQFNRKGNKTYCSIIATLKNFEDSSVRPISKVFVGETTLSENDTDDEIKGKHVAETKAKLMAYKDIRKIFKNYFNALEKDYKSAKYFNDMLNHLVKSETEHFNWLK